MSLIKQVEDDFKVAFKSKDTNALEALKMARAAIKNAVIEKKTDLTDEEVVEILSREVKKRKESVEIYERAGDTKRAGTERAQMNALTKYLPEQLTREEIVDIVSARINELGASGSSDMGRVMGVCMSELKQKADGKMVKDIVQSQLNA